MLYLLFVPCALHILTGVKQGRTKIFSLVVELEWEINRGEIEIFVPDYHSHSYIVVSSFLILLQLLDIIFSSEFFNVYNQAIINFDCNGRFYRQLQYSPPMSAQTSLLRALALVPAQLQYR